MCGRFIQISHPEVIRLGIPDLLIDPAVQGEFCCPGTISRHTEHFHLLNTERPTLTLHTLGLIPSWARDPSMGARMITPGRTLKEKISFKGPFRKRRCISCRRITNGSPRAESGCPIFIRMERTPARSAWGGPGDRWKDIRTGARSSPAPSSLPLPTNLARSDPQNGCPHPEEQKITRLARFRHSRDETLMQCIAPSAGNDGGIRGVTAREQPVVRLPRVHPRPHGMRPPGRKPAPETLAPTTPLCAA